jgi:3-hydroxyisobutyrate dehydrogenase
MGRSVFPLQNRGSGSWAKLLNNFLLARNMRDLAKIYCCSSEEAKIEPKMLHDVLLGSSGNCWSNEFYCPVPDIVAASPSSNGYGSGFTLKLMLKDLRLLQESLAHGSSRELLTEDIQDVISDYERASAKYGDCEDFSIVYQLYAQRVHS